jgi:hypothetical protein
MATVDAVLDAPIDAVVSVLSDPRTYDGVVLGSRRVRWFDAAWPAPRSRFHHTVGFGPVTIRDHTEVIRDDLPGRLELATGIRPLGVLRAVFRLTEEQEGTRVEMTEEPLSGPVARIWSWPLEALTRVRNRATLRRLGDLARVRAQVRTLDGGASGSRHGGRGPSFGAGAHAVCRPGPPA